MTRSLRERLDCVERLLGAARRVYASRAQWIEPLVQTTGLSPEGVRAGFECLEREASRADLVTLVDGAGDAHHVHVILSANVFVAPLRALAVARAAGGRVTVRPSPRDPVLARALVAAADDDAITLTADRAWQALGADAMHVYGGAETLRAVRADARAGVRVRGHGPGFGVAVVTSPAAEGAAAAVARDVALFDQRGCLSARLVLVLGDEATGRAFAALLDHALAAFALAVPRGSLTAGELADARLWSDALTFAGELKARAHHAVGFLPSGRALLLPPPGRHVLVSCAPSLAHVARAWAPLAGYLVAVGSDAVDLVRTFCPEHARVSPLGAMQTPPLDGPVDRRAD